MKKWIIGIVLVLALAGCDKPYLPGDFADALDNRIIELHRAKELYPSAECANVISSDLEFLEILQEASR